MYVLEVSFRCFEIAGGCISITSSVGCRGLRGRYAGTNGSLPEKEGTILLPFPHLAFVLLGIPRSHVSDLSLASN